MNNDNLIKENQELKQKLRELETMRETALKAQFYEDENQRMFTQLCQAVQRNHDYKDKTRKALEIIEGFQPLEKQKSDIQKLKILLQ